MVSRILRRAGYEVIEAASGEEALRLASIGPAVIVLDVKLPDISGFEVCRMLKSRPESASIFILQTSATFVSADKKVEGLNSGADGYLTHPFEAAELIATIQSMLRLRAAEAELRGRAEALAEADRRKDEFLAMLAHELRNPLAAMASAVPLIPQYKSDEARLARLCGVLDRQTKHLARLIDDLLDVARITRGKIELRREPLDLMMILREVVELARPTYAAREQTLSAEIPDAPFYVDGDGARLQQVFSNLLDNALKYSDQGGRTRLTVELVSSDEKPSVLVRVRDEGIGMEAQVLPHIFELFTQADESLARTRGGMGIGLTLVKRLVELHDGRIAAESKGLGRGSQFDVYLPLTARRTEPVVVPLEAAPRATRGCSILLVEDNFDSGDCMRELLEDAGHQVVLATDGLSGLRKATAEHFDVGILDIGLPGIDGYELAERIRSHARHRIFLIALTGYGGPEQRRRALGAGFDRHLVKPVDTDLLLQVVNEGCGKGAVASSAG